MSSSADMPPAGGAAPILSLHEIEKRYGDHLGVNRVSLEVREGEFLTLLGPSGCGKTTTLHLIAGLLQPDAGRVLLRGQDITALRPARRDMGVVFQNYALFPHKTVAANVGFGLKMRGVDKPEIERRTREMLELVGLPGMEKRYPRQLSGGQRQRVALARALVIHPTILLLDEPLSNLDAVLRKRMREELRAIQRRLGITSIFVTHDQEEAFEISDRVILMNQGRIEQRGRPEDLYDRPASRFAAEFIGEANILAGTVRSADSASRIVDTACGLSVKAPPDPAASPGATVSIVIRPERIDIGRRPEGPAGEGKGIIAERAFSGSVVRFLVKLADGTLLRVVKQNVPEFSEIAVGTPVAISVSDCQVIEHG